MYICGRGIGVLKCIQLQYTDTPTTNIHDLTRSSAGRCIHFNAPIPLPQIYMTAHVLVLVHVYISIHWVMYICGKWAVMYICGRGVSVLKCIHVPALERERSCIFVVGVMYIWPLTTSHVLVLVHVYTSIHWHPYHKYTWPLTYHKYTWPLPQIYMTAHLPQIYMTPTTNTHDRSRSSAGTCILLKCIHVPALERERSCIFVVGVSVTF
jgi:hypothetical protein